LNEPFRRTVLYISYVPQLMRWRVRFGGRQATDYIDGVQHQVNPEWGRQEKEKYNVYFLIGTMKKGGVVVMFRIVDRIVLLEPHWTLKAQNRAFGRVNRIGESETPISIPTMSRLEAESMGRPFCDREIVTN
jgi:hypothetical protein